MRVHAVKLGVASAVAFSILWLACSGMVALMPEPMMTISGHMVHADLGELAWSLSWAGVLAGLIAWAVVAGVSAWLIGSIYNRLAAGAVRSD